MELFFADKVIIGRRAWRIIPLPSSMETHHTAVFIAIIIIRFSWCPVRVAYSSIVVNPNKPSFTIPVIATDPNVDFSM